MECGGCSVVLGCDHGGLPGHSGWEQCDWCGEELVEGVELVCRMGGPWGRRQGTVVDGDICKETVKCDGYLAFVAEGFIARLAVGLVDGTLPLQHVVLPVGGVEVSVARPLGATSGVWSSWSLDGYSGTHAVEFISHWGHLVVTEGAWEEGC